MVQFEPVKFQLSSRKALFVSKEQDISTAIFQIEYVK
jgi:hypothetical protein